MSDRYHVSVSKDDLVFSAAHFITFDDQCERLHGHNYRVRAEAWGPLGEHQFVIDFVFLRDALKEIVTQLDHRVLLPTHHPTISVETQAGEVTARFEDRRWVFPQADCALLPVSNTTAELLARMILDKLVEKLTEGSVPIPEVLTVAVEENFGQWGTCERSWAADD